MVLIQDKKFEFYINCAKKIFQTISIVISKQPPQKLSTLKLNYLCNHDNVSVLDRLLLLVWSVKNLIMLNVNTGPVDHKTPQYCHYRTLYWAQPCWSRPELTSHQHLKTTTKQTLNDVIDSCVGQCCGGGSQTQGIMPCNAFFYT